MMMKALGFFLVIVIITQLLLSVSLVNSIRSQAAVKRYYKSHHNKVKQNFSTSIKIIDLSRLRITSSSSSSSLPSSIPSRLSTRQTTMMMMTSAVKSANLVLKKRKKIKLKRKKLQRIDGTILNGNFIISRRKSIIFF
jgi:valyl-tRNA synthetase